MRVHEAAAVACTGCGAPLPVDVSAPWSWCPACHAWRPVPDEVRRRAWERWSALAGAHAAAAQERALATRRSSQASAERVKGGVLGVVLAIVVLTVTLPTLASIAVYFVAAFLTAFDELELWAAVLVTALGGALSLGFFLALVGACVFLYRRATRHRRWQRLSADAEWHGREASRALICCGECGAPLSFEPSEHAVQCGHCRSVVIAPEEHTEAVISVALSELQLARRARATSDRALLRSKVAMARRATAFKAWMYAGTMALFAVPLLAFGYAVRALTPSLEEAMLSLSKQLRGEFGAGLDPAFEWLDRYWLGDTPPSFDAQGTFTSRWSIAAAFHGRPVLVSVLASWTDLSAKVAAVVLASPRQRDVTRVTASAAAVRARELGFQVWVDYAGIALVAQNLSQKALGADHLTALARLAYELGEER